MTLKEAKGDQWKGFQYHKLKAQTVCTPVASTLSDTGVCFHARSVSTKLTSILCFHAKFMLTGLGGAWKIRNPNRISVVWTRFCIVLANVAHPVGWHTDKICMGSFVRPNKTQVGAIHVLSSSAWCCSGLLVPTSRSKMHPGQVTIPSQGHIRTMHAHSHVVTI